MAQKMAPFEYELFRKETLTVTLCPKNATGRFLKWLQQCSNTRTDITPLALSIINFLARETIAGIIDKALEIKSRQFDESNHYHREKFCYPVSVFDESDYELEPPEMNLQQPLSEASKDSSCYQKLQKFPVDTSEKNKIAESDIINSSLSIAIDGRERSMTIKSNSTGNLVTGEQEKGTTVMSTELHQNSSSKSCANNISDFSPDAPAPKRKKSDSASASKKTLGSKAKKNKKSDVSLDATPSKQNLRRITKINETKPNTCINVKCPNTSHFVDKDISSDCKRDEVFSDTHDTSEKVSKKHNFSLNFEEKLLSISYDGSKTFNIDGNSALEDRYSETADADDEDFGSSCFVEYVEKSDLDDLERRELSRDFIIIPRKIDTKVYWFPYRAITPSEIQAALEHYQQPLPGTFVLQTDFPNVEPRKTKLVCLNNPDDFVQCISTISLSNSH